jgi:hypothetical protein
VDRNDEPVIIATNVENGDGSSAFHRNRIGGRIGSAKFLEVFPSGYLGYRAPVLDPFSGLGELLNRFDQEWHLNDAHGDKMSSFA